MHQNETKHTKEQKRKVTTQNLCTTNLEEKSWWLILYPQHGHWKSLACVHCDGFVFVDFGDSKGIIFFLSFPSLQAHPLTLPLSASNSSIFGSSIVIACVCIFIDTYMFLNIPWWIHITLLVCMFSGLPVWPWTANYCVYHGKECFPTPHLLSNF